MKLYTVKSEGLAHNSYMVVDNGEAIVIDPRRDCEIYTLIAKKNCAKITYVFETHRNEDYVVGSLELQTLTDAEISHSKDLAFKYGQHNLDDEETLTVGNLKIKALSTPGHTNESLCYAVIDAEKSEEPIMLFSGDTLFVGSIGRTDLQGKNAQPQQAEKLYTSLHEKLGHLGDDVSVFPAHGSGSVCGSGIGEQEASTMGYERNTNPFLKYGKEEFVKKALSQELIVPAYFRKMEDYNLRGAPLLSGLSDPNALDASDFESCMNESESVVVDTRMPYAFGGAHIPGSLSLWLGGGTSVYAGWILSYDDRILLVVERREDVDRVLRHLRRLGYGNVYSYLCKGVSDWQEQGKTIDHVHTLQVSDLKAKLERYLVLDVREPSEWHEEGVIKGAEQVFFADLPQKADRLERNKRYAVTCSVGNRSSTAVSILKRKGFGEISNVLGGMTAWQRLGYPTVKAKPQEP